MANPIVIVNVSQQQAPTPADLQKKGALISQGGTTLVPGMTAMLTQFADLEDHLVNPAVIASGSWTGGVATMTAANPHGVPVNNEFTTVLEDNVPADYNGTRRCVAISATEFSFDLPATAANPSYGPITTPGTFLPAAAHELESMARTFFNQPSLQSVFILEVGGATVAEGLETLQDFIDQNVDQQVFYSYLLPRHWDAEADLLDFIANFEALDAKTYFFITTNVSNWRAYDDTMKPAFVLVEAPPYQPVAAQDITAGAWAAGVATLTFAANHGVKPGQYFTVNGTNPAGYSGMWRAIPGSTGTSLKYELTTDPGGILTTMGKLVANVYSSPGVAPEEFSLASVFHRTLAYDPSTTSRVSPLCFGYTFGVTRFPTQGNSALLSDIKAANVNYIGYGGEGGISNNMIVWGRMMDGRPFNYWYAVDWVQIEAKLRLANTVINGSNTEVNPLYYNQDGINRLEQSLYQVGNNAVAFGLALGDVRQVGLPANEFANNLNKGDYAGLVIINAEPFVDYTRAHPGDYKIGKYGGLAFVFTPQRGFEQIIVHVNVTDIVTP